MVTEQHDCVEWEVCNPCADKEVLSEVRAPRLHSLSGKRIGLFANGKPGSDSVVSTVGKLLQERFGDLSLETFILCQDAGAENIKRMAECDAVVSAIGD